jgi:hypothetical protein
VAVSASPAPRNPALNSPSGSAETLSFAINAEP